MTTYADNNAAIREDQQVTVAAARVLRVYDMLQVTRRTMQANCAARQAMTAVL